MIKIDVHATHAVVRQQKPLTVGLVGAKVRFSFGEDWDGLVKTAVFRQGDVTVDAVNVSGESIIPWEVLTQPGLPVQIGICGINSDGTVVIPTLWAETEPVQPGADPSGDTSAAAALPVYQQILAQIGPLDQLDTEAKDTLVAAINEANRAVCLVTAVQNEDGTYSADKSIEELSAAEDAGKVLLCYLRDVRVLTGLTGGNRSSTYVFTAVIGNTEYRVVMNENGVFCDCATLATEQSRLPNPEKLTFAGAVQAEYDGSTPVNVDIPKLLEVALTASGDTWSADKTYAQILEAYNSGAEVRCRYRSDYVFRLTRLNPGIAEFYGLVNGVGYSIYITAGNTLTVTQTPWAKAGDIPTQTSQLENDSGYLTTAPVTSVNGQTGAVELDIPEVPGTLPNPEKLTFEGAVSATYDGYSPVVVNIPKGGSGVHVGSEPPADPSVNVWIDPEGGDGDLDLTIPDALPNPEKLTFTGILAEYDGSAPVSVTIPTKTSDLKNDSGYVTSVPDALPNPHKLTFTGAVTGEYDGSQAVTVALPKTMVVTLTHSNGVYTADTTYDEISEAYEAGQEVRCNYQDMLLPLVQYSSFFVIFACVYNTKLYSVLIKATDNSVTMTVTDASASGDADLSGYIPAPETAAVGQTVAVKAVDETGKPTQWEAVDMASGGGQWKLINTITTTEDALRKVTCTTDSEGQPFSLTEVYVKVVMAASETVKGDNFIYLNGSYFNGPTASTTISRSSLYANGILNQVSVAIGNYERWILSADRRIPNTPYIVKIELVGQASSANIPIGTTIEIYGR